METREITLKNRKERNLPDFIQQGSEPCLMVENAAGNRNSETQKTRRHTCKDFQRKHGTRNK